MGSQKRADFLGGHRAHVVDIGSHRLVAHVEAVLTHTLGLAISGHELLLGDRARVDDAVLGHRQSVTGAALDVLAEDRLILIDAGGRHALQHHAAVDGQAVDIGRARHRRRAIRQQVVAQVAVSLGPRIRVLAVLLRVGFQEASEELLAHLHELDRVAVGLGEHLLGLARTGHDSGVEGHQSQLRVFGGQRIATNRTPILLAVDLGRALLGQRLDVDVRIGGLIDTEVGCGPVGVGWIQTALMTQREADSAIEARSRTRCAFQLAQRPSGVVVDVATGGSLVQTLAVLLRQRQLLHLVDVHVGNRCQQGSASIIGLLRVGIDGLGRDLVGGVQIALDLGIAGPLLEVDGLVVERRAKAIQAIAQQLLAPLVGLVGDAFLGPLLVVVGERLGEPRRTGLGAVLTGDHVIAPALLRLKDVLCGARCGLVVVDRLESQASVTDGRAQTLHAFADGVGQLVDGSDGLGRIGADLQLPMRQGLLLVAGNADSHDQPFISACSSSTRPTAAMSQH